MTWFTRKLITFLLAAIAFVPLAADPWIPDLGNGRYRNPVLFADYSDPDVIRVGEDFYLVASSFTVMPGIPVLHSKDLVNWSIVGHVYDRLPFGKFDKPAHGHGSWAPSIRYHDGLYYVYFCAPHTGLFVATAKNPAGPWQLEQMASVELWEDPAPFWDENGNAYLVRSKVRADYLYLHRMSPDGKRLLDDGRVIYHDLDEQPVIEGPKMMKKDGYYYILAPAGGVREGWQAALRSRDPYGPYESRVVLHSGDSGINGPHQGGLVELESGKWWFLHFQERGHFGRVAHLQPVRWEDGWPLMGQDSNGDGIGEPVKSWRKPDVGVAHPVRVPQTSDEFDGPGLGLQWQWHANPERDWYGFDPDTGMLRLNMVQNLSQGGNLWFVPNLLLQKVPAPAFSATTRIRFRPVRDGDKSGLVVMGREWGYIALYRTGDGVRIGVFDGRYEQYDDATVLVDSVSLPAGEDGAGWECDLRVEMDADGAYRFSWRSGGEPFQPLGAEMQAQPGVWIGAKIGLFALNAGIRESEGYAGFDWFRVE